MKKKVTIRDVAKAAGVSITTTSQVMQGIGRYSDATIKRVWDVVNELNYTPNAYARKYFSSEISEHQATGLLMRITYCPFGASFFEPSGHEPLRMYYFERACMERNYTGANYIFRHEIGLQNRLLVNDLVDGLILGIGQLKLIDQLRKRAPAVLTDINVDPEMVGLPVVNCDFVKGYTQLFHIMKNAGISGKMAVFTGVDPANKNTLPEDIAALRFLRAAELCGVDIPKQYRFVIPVSTSSNDEVMIKIADQIVRLVRKEGIRIVGLRYLGSLKPMKNLLIQRGLHLPEDIILMGNTDLPMEESGIAVVTYDWEGIMETAVDVLLRRVNGKETVCGKYLVPPKDCNGFFLRTSKG